MTYDFTKGRLGALLLDTRAVSLRVQEEGAHGALGLVGILIKEQKYHVSCEQQSKRPALRLQRRFTFLTFHAFLERFLGAATSSSTDSSSDSSSTSSDS